MANESTALTVVPVETTTQNQLVLLGDPKALRHQLDQMKAIVNEYLDKDQDYGVIPGTGNKPTLLKPGAEKLMELYGLFPTYRCIDKTEDWDKKPALFDYTYECTVKRRTDGMIFGVGVGSCSSYESKFRYRHAAKNCPECDKQSIIKGKEEYGGGWVCFKAKGGCGSKWPDGSAIIEKQETGKIENADLADQKNTVIKQGCKRALISAVLAATRSSGIFTQDIEDFKKAAAFDYGDDVIDGEIVDEAGKPGPKPSTASSQTTSRQSQTQSQASTKATEEKKSSVQTVQQSTPQPGAAAAGANPQESKASNQPKKSDVIDVTPSQSQTEAGAQPATGTMSANTELINDEQRKGLLDTAKRVNGWTPPQVAMYLKKIGGSLTKLTKDQLDIALDHVTKNAP